MKRKIKRIKIIGERNQTTKKNKEEKKEGRK